MTGFGQIRRPPFATSPEFLQPRLYTAGDKLQSPHGMETAFSGLLAFGIPEPGAVIAVAIMGKPGFEMIKSRFFARLRHFHPAEQVSSMRYRIGLVMFCLPMLYGWLEPSVRPVIEYEFHWSQSLTLDLVFIARFFVLGDGFWDKIRAFFLHRESVAVPEIPQSSNTCENIILLL